jgi:hypothetical protein
VLSIPTFRGENFRYSRKSAGVVRSDEHLLNFLVECVTSSKLAPLEPVLNKKFMTKKETTPRSNKNREQLM